MMQKPSLSGLTLKSILAAIFALLLMGVLIQYFELIVLLTFPAEHTLAFPAMWVFVLITVIGGLFFVVTRTRLLNRQEQLCVLFCMLLSAPLMTQGFWHRVVSIVATIPREADFAKIDAFHSRLWPHGPNLLDGVCETGPEDGRISFHGNVEIKNVDVNQTDTGEPVQGSAVVVRNDTAVETSSVKIKIPLYDADGNLYINPGEPYMVHVLVRPSDSTPDTRYFCRVYVDNDPVFTEFFSGRTETRKTFMQRTGFVRVGSYGIRLPGPVQTEVTVEFGLHGQGYLEMTDFQFFNIEALEGIYNGRMIVRQSVFDDLPPERRAGLVAKPDNMLSWDGIKFILSGYIPIRDWVTPFVTWTSIIALILIGTFSINCIMRKQWMDSERYQLPVTKIPLSLLGEDDDHTASAMPAIYRNKLAWAGFALGMFWLLMKAWAFYNPKVPDMTVRVMLQPIFSDPGWGNMWRNVRFEITTIFLSMCIFMELNVLISLVAGYFLFRSQFWFGEAFGMTADPNYPFAPQQAIGAYVAYALITLFFTRKYIWRVIRAAVVGDRTESEGEVMSYRKAVLLLLATVAGSAVWAYWMKISIVGMLLFFVFILVIGFVTAKIRTECGAPWGYFAPINLALIMILLGGVSAFGGRAVLFGYILSFMISPTVFFLIPGAQMEMIELGRQWNIKKSHIVSVVLIGIFGGMLIGGWIFLSNAYAIGGDSMRYSWSFNTKPWYLFTFNRELDIASTKFFDPDSVSVVGVAKAWYAFGYAAFVTVVVSVLRQMFAGFWLHPVAFVLGSSNFLDYVWGSALTAAVLRWIVLKIGGASAVRNKLRPFFVGVFMGGCTAYLLLGIHMAYLRHLGIEKVYQILLP